jgi:hypothetical protein
MTDRELAEKIALELCTNNADQTAERLQLRLAGDRDGGGRSYRNVVLVVENMLRLYRREPVNG